MTKNIPDKINKLAEELVNLPLKDINVLLEVLKTEHGIEPVAMVAPSAIEVSSKKVEEEKEEKSIFDVMLVSSGTSKLGVIRAVKSILDLGLKEAKDLVDNLPQPIKEGIPKEAAEKIKKELMDAGAQVELK